MKELTVGELRKMIRRMPNDRKIIISDEGGNWHVPVLFKPEVVYYREGYGAYKKNELKHVLDDIFNDDDGTVEFEQCVMITAGED